MVWWIGHRRHSSEASGHFLRNALELRGRTILVTGGAGFIGSHLADVLSDCTLRIVDDFSTGREENLKRRAAQGNLEIVRGDLRDRSMLPALLNGVDVVFHLACRGVRHSIGHPFENHEVNATATLHLLEAAQRARVPRFVHVSSSEVYGTAQSVPMEEDHPTYPETVYGAAKLAGESYARAWHQTYGFPTIIVRPFNNFGPRSHHEGDSGEVIPRFVVWALNGQAPVIFGDGLQTRDFIYVEDTAYWLRRAAECDALVGQTVNLGSGTETSIRELSDLVYNVVRGAPIAPQFLAPRPGDVRRHAAGISKARGLLGFETRVSLREGIERTVAYLRSRSDDVRRLLAETHGINWVMSNSLQD
jgi:UDP-glucose 4-epimerase